MFPAIASPPQGGRTAGVVSGVAAGDVEVDWLAAADDSRPPPALISARALKALTFYAHTCWQLGDRVVIEDDAPEEGYFAADDDDDDDDDGGGARAVSDRGETTLRRRSPKKLESASHSPEDGVYEDGTDPEGVRRMYARSGEDAGVGVVQRGTATRPKINSEAEEASSSLLVDRD